MKKLNVIFGKEVHSEWRKLLPGARGQAQAYFDLVVGHLEAAEVSGVTWEYKEWGQDIKLGGGIKGEKRTFLMVEASPFPKTTQLVGAQNFGSYLSVSRILHKPVAEGDHILDGLKFFQQDVFFLFCTLVQHAAATAATELQNQLGHEETPLDVLTSW